jgi:lipopolysaccharide biosynthesis glycosyltransferase
VLALVQQADTVQPTPELSAFRDRLAVELGVLNSLGLSNGDDGSHPHPIPTGFPYAERAATLTALLLRRPLPPVPAQVPRRRLQTFDQTVVFCTDDRYLLGTCVALNSLLRHNRETAASCRLLVVCADDAAATAAAAVGAIAASAPADVELLPTAALFPQDDRIALRTGWGCFTPGDGLSEAAYYRLFAVHNLLTAGGRGRVLYLDSDTCVGPGVDQLFKHHLDGQPLAARYELRLPGIEQAAHRLDLDVETYFNSGVLLFDLGHPALSALLANAIDIAVERPDLLTFLDQCALNVAFEGRVSCLRPEDNFYTRPTDEVDPTIMPVVRHYLTRWKPWDPTYPGDNSRPWLIELDALADVLPARCLHELLAVQFEPRASYAVPA